jgi:hypothetical protein
MFKWILSRDKKYLYAEHNHSIRSDLHGNIYGGGCFGGDDEPEKIAVDIPDFYTDKYYTSSQETLLPFASSLLQGNIPDYYKGIGEYGGAELESILGLVNRDTTKAVNENLVRRGISRSGVGASSIAKATADASTNLRWSDYQRALTGRQNLLNLGVNTMSGVGTSGLNYGNSLNQYSLNKAGIETDIAKTNYQIEANKKAQEDAMWASILSSTIGAAGSVVGMGMLGSALGSTTSGAGALNTGVGGGANYSTIAAMLGLN